MCIKCNFDQQWCLTIKHHLKQSENKAKGTNLTIFYFNCSVLLQRWKTDSAVNVLTNDIDTSESILCHMHSTALKKVQQDQGKNSFPYSAPALNL